jgi:predicted dehydrogenase
MKVAIIGLGEISKLHVNALIENGCEIVAICDIIEERCFSTNKEFNLTARTYVDYREMLDTEVIDAVHICTPHYLHAEMICYALNKNINVLSEKPLAISLSQLEEIEKVVKTTTATLGVCQQNRYNDAVIFTKEYFKDKKITSAYGNLCWKRDEAYYSQGEWRGKWDTEGGGVMINQALHTLDLLQWFCGMPKTVKATTFNHSLKNVIEVEDTAFGLFTVDNETNFVMTATNSAKYSFPIVLNFASGNDVVQITMDNVIINGEFFTKKDGKSAIGKEVWGTGHVKLIADYYSKLEKGEKFPIDFYEASKVVKLILAMYRSNGNEINI